jgi:hypothetical protein
MPVPENQPERVRQQVVNWSDVMAFIADWTIAIVSYIFFVLLSGLIFGMLGGYADRRFRVDPVTLEGVEVGAADDN